MRVRNLFIALVTSVLTLPMPAPSAGAAAVESATAAEAAGPRASAESSVEQAGDEAENDDRNAVEGDPNVVVDPALYRAMDYRLIGPFRGGRSTAVTGVRQDTETFYMGTTGGGVWKTTDGGEIWRNVSDGSFSVGSIGAIAVAPSDPNVVYVGTGSACPRGNVSTGKGVYRSTDAGDTWEFAGLPEAGQIGRVVVDPRDPDRVLVAALGNVFGPNEERGVYRSTDGGESWERVLFVSQETGAVDLSMDPTNPRILYAAMWRVERKPWTLIDGGEEGGVYRSVDGGDTWSRLSGAGKGEPGHGLPDGLLGRSAVAVSPANPDRIWVLQQHAEEELGGLYRSDDGGRTWKRVNRDHELRQRGWYYTHITADPVDEYTVYGLNVDFFRSTDGGRTFDEEIDVPHGDNHDLWIHPDHPEIMIEANDGGANVSTDAGASWSTQRNQPTAEFYRVEVDGAFPYRVYGSQQDNSSISVPSRSPGGITPKQHWTVVGGGESGHIAVHPQDPDVVWAGTYSGEITRVDLEKGYERQVTAYPHYTEGQEMRDLKYRFQWNAPIEISPHDPEVVYHASQYVNRTTDGGQSWEIVSPDLTRPVDEHMGIPGGPIQHDATGVEVYHSIFALAPSPDEPGTIWAGTDDGLVWITRDGGESWQEITPAGMPHEGTVNSIDLSAHEPGRALIAVYRYRRDDFRPYVFRTNDFGESWELLTDGTNGIPADHFVRVVREDPDRKGLLYAGTEFGVHVSFDDGAHWQPLQLDLPRTPVTDLLVHRQDLVLSTQGRSFWILDDLTPLHQIVDLIRGGGGEDGADDRDAEAVMNGGGIAVGLTEDGIPSAIARDGAWLLAPRAAWRTQMWGFRGERAPDPIPRGVEIAFYLDGSLLPTAGARASETAGAAEPGGPGDEGQSEAADEGGEKAEKTSGRVVRLEILEADGDVVRTWSTRPGEVEEHGFSLEDRRLELEPGMHKLEWDLRYPGPFLVSDLVTMVMNNPQPGPTAPPGTYRARLSVVEPAAGGDRGSPAGGSGPTGGAAPDSASDPAQRVLWSAEREFEVRMDPRWEGLVSDADLQEQFELAIEIRDTITESQRMVAALRSAREQAKGIASRAGTARALGSEQADALQETAEALGKKLTELEDRLIQNRIESGQDAIGMERRFTNFIGRLFTLVIREDARPTAGVLERWADLEEELVGYRERFEELMATDVAAFNEQVKEAGLPAVIVPSGS